MSLSKCIIKTGTKEEPVNGHFIVTNRGGTSICVDIYYCDLNR